jgi:hypothetical protein
MIYASSAALRTIAETLIFVDDGIHGLCPIALPEMVCCGDLNASLILKALKAEGFVLFKTSSRRP